MKLSIQAVQPPQLRRVKHDKELGPLWRADPEVFQLWPQTPIPFDEPLQRLAYAMNAPIALNHWRSIFAAATAFNNGTGFDNPSSPRADFISGRDLDQRIPMFDKPRVCGGASLRGFVSGNNLVVDTIRIDLGELPTLEWMQAHPWYAFTALIVSGDDGHVFHFPQGEGKPVRIPLVSMEQVSISLDNLESLPAGSWLTDPFYIPSLETAG